MSDIEYKDSPPTLQEYHQLFSSTGWMPILKISENNLMKAFNNTWYWVIDIMTGMPLVVDIDFRWGFICIDLRRNINAESSK